MFLLRVITIIFVSGTTFAATNVQAADQGAILDQALAEAGTDDGGATGVYPIEPVSASSRWDGGYVGGFLAYTRSGLYDSIGPVDGISSFEGWMAGLDAGFDFKLDGGVIAGVVGDIVWADVNAVDAVSGDIGRIGWGGSVRGRVGLDADNLLPYVTAGVAVASAQFSSPDGLETVAGTHLGWTVGIGLEAAVDEQISIDLLYRYSDYGMVDYSYSSPTETTVQRGMTAQQVSLGINFAF